MGAPASRIPQDRGYPLAARFGWRTYTHLGLDTKVVATQRIM